jgi:hypothetical protein
MNPRSWGAKRLRQLLKVGRVFVCLVTASLVAVLIDWGAAQELPLDYEERFDQLVLTEDNNHVVVRVFPLDFHPGNEPDHQQPLRVRILEYPDRQYEVAWRDIERIEYFEDVLLAKALDLSRQAKYEDAYRLLAYVRRNQPTWRGLAEATDEFLLQDAVGAYKRRQFDESLVVLDELFRGERQKQKSGRAIITVANRSVDESLKRGDYRAARRVVDWVRQRPGLGAATKIAEWQDQIQAIAAQHLESARQALNENDYRRALAAVDLSLQVRPEDDQAQALAAAILEQYPRVAVGVSRVGGRTLDYYYDWARRRTDRLVGRALLELQSYGANGGDYTFPLGQLLVDEDEKGARLVLSDGYQRNAAELAQFVENLACDGELPCQPMLHRLLDSVHIEPGRGLHLRLRRRALRWLPLLDVPLRSSNLDKRMIPYARRQNGLSEDAVFLASDAYAWDERGRPTEIVERVYGDSTAMIKALLAGDVDLVDRISPAEANRLRGAAQLTVGDYAFPSVYFLVPNPNRRLMQERTFRRAIAYGIHRESILKNVLLGGQQFPGCQLITGPFPAATRPRDSMAYAYDTGVEPRRFDPALAAALAAMARQRVLMDTLDERSTMIPQAKQDSVNEDGSRPVEANADVSADDTHGVAEHQLAVLTDRKPLVLVYPPDAMLAPSAEAIARSLNLSGIECESRPLPSGQVRPPGEDWDLWMIDVTFQEPIVDIHRIFEPGGLVGQPSTYVIQALDDLLRTTSWASARAALHDIHQLVHAELPFLPLWQLSNHSCHSDRVQGMTASAIGLYQDVERWRVSR